LRRGKSVGLIGQPTDLNLAEVYMYRYSTLYWRKFKMTREEVSMPCRPSKTFSTRCISVWSSRRPIRPGPSIC